MAGLDLARFKIAMGPESTKVQGLREGDIALRQYFDNTTQYYSLMLVESIGNDVESGDFFVGKLIDGDEPGATGSELLDFVRVTNLFNIDRMGALYMTGSESGAPFMDVIDALGRESATVWPNHISPSPGEYYLSGGTYGVSEFISENRSIKITRNATANVNSWDMRAYVGLHNDTLTVGENYILSYRHRASKNISSLGGQLADSNGQNNNLSMHDDISTEWGYSTYAFSCEYSTGSTRWNTYIATALSDGDWIEYADFSIIPMSSLINRSSSVKMRSGKLDGITDETFGKLSGYGQYVQKLYATKDVNIAGTLTAGDKNGQGYTFYAGKIAKNLLPVSNVGDATYVTRIDSSTTNDILPSGETGLVRVLNSNGTADPYFGYSRQVTHSEKTLTFSFWAKRISGSSESTIYLYSSPTSQVKSSKLVLTDEWARYSITNKFESTTNTGIIARVDLEDSGVVGQEVQVFGFQLEEGDSITPYQPTDSILSTEDGYGMWASRGGFGGTIQNPLLKINADGTIVGGADKLILRPDGSAEFNGEVVIGGKSAADAIADAQSGAEQTAADNLTAAKAELEAATSKYSGIHDGEWAVSASEPSFEFTFPAIQEEHQDYIKLALLQYDLEAHVQVLCNGEFVSTVNGSDATKQWKYFTLPSAHLNSDSDNIIIIEHDGGAADWGTIFTVQLDFDSKKYTEDKADDAEQNAKDASDPAGSANTAKGEAISAAASDASTKVKNIKVGGVNLLQVVSVISAYTDYNNISNAPDGRSIVLTQKRAGGTITFQNGANRLNGDVIFSGKCLLNGSPISESFFHGNRLSTFFPAGTCVVDPTTGYFEITQIFDGSSAWWMHVATDSVTIGDTIEFIDFMAEYGNKASAWSAAPQDIEGDYTSKIATAKTEAEDFTDDALTELKDNYLGDIALMDTLEGGKITDGTVDFAKFGSTVVSGGYIKTELLDANAIRANVINVGYIEGLSLNFTQGKIGGWIIDDNDLYSGSLYLNGTYGYITSQVGAVTKWKLHKDGSGTLASGNIAWDALGNVTFGSGVVLDWDNLSPSVQQNIDAKDTLNLFFDDTHYNVPTNTDIDGAKKFTFNSDWSGPCSIWIKGNDFEGGIRAQLNGTYLGTMSAPDLATEIFKFNADITSGSNELSIWSTTSDGGTIYEVNIKAEPIQSTKIDANGIYTGTLTANQVNAASATILGAVTAGSFNIGSGKFTVAADGTLVATGATINGNITANSGSIGGWTINSNRITRSFGVSKLSVGESVNYSNWHGLELFRDDGNRINMMAHSNGSDYEFRIRRGNKDMFFATDTETKISGWTFDENCLQKGVGSSSEDISLVMNAANTSNSASSYVYDLKRKLAGFSMTWHKTSNAGHIVMGQLAASGNSLKTGYHGIQMMNWVGEEFFALSAKTDEVGSRPTYNRIAGWAFDHSKIYSGAIEMHKDGYIRNTSDKWRLNSDGSGGIASNNIAWDAAGNVTFAPSVKLEYSSNNLIKAPWSLQMWGNAHNMPDANTYFHYYNRGENSGVINDLTPYDSARGRHSKWTWITRGVGIDSWNGGMMAKYNFRTSESYMYTQWVRVINPSNTASGTCNTYMGICATDSGSTQNISSLGNTQNTNPYFLTGSSSSFTSGWYLFVGIIYHKGAVDGSGQYSGGIYDELGNKIASGTAWKWTSSSPEQVTDGIRTGYYRAASGYQFIQDPQLYVMDGSEPSIADLVGMDGAKTTQITNNTVETTNVLAQNLRVKAAKIDGILEASQIKAEDLEVQAANIQGELVIGQMDDDAKSQILNNNIKVGGRNLISNSDFREGNSGWAISDGAALNKSGSIQHFGDIAYYFSVSAGRQIYKEVVLGTSGEFVFAPYMYGNSGTTNVQVVIMNSSGTVLHSQLMALPTSTWQRGNIVAQLSSGTYRVGVICISGGSLLYDQHWYFGLGNKAPDWSSNEGDIAGLLGSDLATLKTQALAGNTVIKGGYINTELIEAGAIHAGKIQTNTITSLGAVTGGSFNLGNNTFVVDTNGNLTAKNVRITGLNVPKVLSLSYTPTTAPSTLPLPTDTSNIFIDYLGVYGTQTDIYLPSTVADGTIYNITIKAELHIASYIRINSPQGKYFNAWGTKSYFGIAAQNDLGGLGTYSIQYFSSLKVGNYSGWVLMEERTIEAV